MEEVGITSESPAATIRASSPTWTHLLQHQISLTEGLHCKAEHGNEVVANQDIWNVCALAAIPYLGGGVLRGQFEQDSITHVGVHE